MRRAFGVKWQHCRDDGWELPGRYEELTVAALLIDYLVYAVTFNRRGYLLCNTGWSDPGVTRPQFDNKNKL
jgi:hypothetical protein